MTELPELPEPPVNVRVTRVGGEEIPLELVYAGLDAEGLHLWRAIGPVGLTAAELAGGAQVRIGTLPARTTIELVLAER